MKGILCFADGTIYKGLGLGIEGESTGRLVHFHGPMDPQFILTDPAVKNLLILSTQPVLGECGLRIGIDQSDSIWAAGLICREVVDFPTHEGHFKNVHRLLESQGGMALTYLDPDPLASLAVDEPMSTILTGPENRLTVKSRRIIITNLRKDSIEGEWDDSASIKRTTDLECADPVGHILLVDLGIRNGMLRFLRERYQITMINPAFVEDEMNRMDFDGIVISGGPGQLPTEELTDYLSTIQGRDHPPVYAYGIGAIALGTACGLPIERMAKAHRGMSVPVSIDGTIIPTYQTHSHTLSPDSDDWTVTSKCAVDGTVDSLRKGSGSILLSMYDPLPDQRNSSQGDPLEEFMVKVKKRAGRESR